MTIDTFQGSQISVYKVMIISIFFYYRNIHTYMATVFQHAKKLQFLMKCCPLEPSSSSLKATKPRYVVYAINKLDSTC